MNTVRKYTVAAFLVACAHLIFGAIVRISGSGMGCGDHWPKCYGSFFPPLSRPDLIIEVSHRYLASILLLSLITLAVVSWRRRSEPGVGGPGGVLNAALLAVTLGFTAALLGAVTVKLGNAPFATLAHWTVAMSLVATVAASMIRAGGLGGASALLGGASAKSMRGAFIGAAMALAAVVMGGLTAKYPGAAVACRAFPLCGRNADVDMSAVWVQSIHRVLAVLVVLHLFGLVMAFRKREEPPIVRRAAVIALSFGVLQLLVAGAMIGMHLPPVLRSLHEAVGVSVWISTFILAYLARIASGGSALGKAARLPSPPLDTSRSGSIRASAPTRAAFAGAVAERSAIETREPWQGATDAYLGAFAMVHHAEPAYVADVTYEEDAFLVDSLMEVADVEDVIDVADVAVAAAVVVPTPEAIAIEAVIVEAVALPVAAVAVEEAVVAPVVELPVAVEEAVVAASIEEPVVAWVADEPVAAVLADEPVVAVVVAEPEAVLAVIDEVPEVMSPEVSAAIEELTAIVAPAPIVAVAPDVVPPDAPVPSVAGLHKRKSTMHHSVAVIVARGADF